MTTQHLLSRSPVVAIILSIVFGMTVPVAAMAATTTVMPTGTIVAATLHADSGQYAYITGTAENATKVRFEITGPSSSKVLAKSSTLKVRSGTWSARVTKKLADGAYTVHVYDYSNSKHIEIATGTLNVGVIPAILKVSSIPLLGGGTAHSGTSVPVSYLQVTNQGTATTTIAGFWVKQNGTTPAAGVIGFSSVDDKGNFRTSSGGTEGSIVLTNGTGYVPSGATIAPRQTKLFTLKAQLSTAASLYTGTTLMLDITGVDASAVFNATTFPIRGTTWVLAK